MVGDPTDEILAAASRLIGELGVGGTPMRRIASEVGLKQSSLYYYFRRKEEILAALVARANVVPLELMRTITADGGTAAEPSCTGSSGPMPPPCAPCPFDINDIHRIAMRDPVEFASYWKERSSARARSWPASSGAASPTGAFRPVDPRLTALTVLANDEGAQNWFRLGSKLDARRRSATHLADLVRRRPAAPTPPRLTAVTAEADAAGAPAPPEPAVEFR